MQFGFSPFKMRKAELIATLNNFLIEQYAAGRKVLLIIDEAQNLSQRVLEEVRLLSGVETTKEKVLRIILAGQPELNDKLDSAELVQLAQRVRLRFHLTALSETDMEAYILHRLRSGRRRRPRALRTRDLPAALPLRRRRPAPGEHAVRHGDDGGLREGPDTVIGGGPGGGGGRAAVGRIRGADVLAPAARDRRHRIGGITADGAALVLTLKGATVQEACLVPGRLFIGRTADNDMQVESKFVSRHHAQIVTTPEGSSIEDLNSTNGIFVRGRRVRRHKLQHGDVVKLGTHEIVYYRAEPPGTSTLVLDGSESETDADEAEQDGEAAEELEDGREA